MPFEKNTVVWASAGTGKTRKLVEVYIELLERGLDPTRIVAVTFTERAAAERWRRRIGLTAFVLSAFSGIAQSATASIGRITGRSRWKASVIGSDGDAHGVHLGVWTGIRQPLPAEREHRGDDQADGDDDHARDE